MASSSKTQLQGKEANQKMSVVRQQVSTLLGAAMKGELLDLRSFLDDFAAAQLREERSQYGLAEGDASEPASLSILKSNSNNNASNATTIGNSRV